MKLSFLLLTVLIATLMACGPRKASYSNIQTDKDGRGANQNNAVPPGDSGTYGRMVENAPAPVAAEPQTAPPEQQKFKVPSFVDPKTGQVKDLPNYPNALRLNSMSGPMQGVDQAFYLLQTADSIDKVAAFYDKIIKSNGWQVVNTTRDKDSYKVVLKKGNFDEGLVQARKDLNTDTVGISITRIEKPAQPKQ